ncbi:hypothetical protein KY330_02880 [Candidatus Woesearchaeota archaeon]|nr:hypothetical protein [Candidatus Woesearchaeota archaeon]
MSGVFHLVKEEIMKEQCPYCGAVIDISNNESQFELDQHYKIQRCPNPDCQKEIHFKVDFNGSGHDDISKNSDFEEIIQKEHENIETNEQQSQ